MTDTERLTVGLTLSLLLHWMLLGWSSPAPEPAAISDEMLFTADLRPPAAALTMDAPMSLESAAPPEEQSGVDAAALRKLALRRYLDRVIRVVHDRRMIVPAAQSLAGNVLVAFVIDGEGRFASVRIVRGSSDEAMNADALQAVRSASGVVPRPPLLGPSPLPVTMPIKYQFGLE